MPPIFLILAEVKKLNSQYFTMKILILFAHPAFQKSKVNRQLVAGLDSIKGVSFRDLYEEYPDFDIDVKKEQELLLQHDCIIFHHPMYWYSMPSLLKEWQDLVLAHGWAYGSTGRALEGKLFFSVLTTGAPQKAFTKKGLHQHSVQELMLPLIQAMQYCRMQCLPPFVVHGTFDMPLAGIKKHKQKYHALLRNLTQNNINLKKASKLDNLSEYKIKEERTDARR
jgi:glutathione-regulated potassium-efflux system ancillary protein KefG